MPKDYDPRMHSAEHILNQTMDRMFRCGRSFEAHIEPGKSRCYYQFDRELGADEVREIESRVNEVIQSDVEVREEFMPRAEVGKWFNLRRVPDDAGDPLRVIRIGDYDACPCIGSHVKRTKEIGGFQIYSTSYEGGVLKVRFRLSEP